MLKHKSTLAFVLVIATSLVAAACGSDDDKKSDGGVDSGQQDATEQDTSQEDTGTDAGDKDAQQEDGTTTDAPPGELCNGSATEIVLSVNRPVLGNLPPEVQFMDRNGVYAILTGDCTVHCSAENGRVFTTKYDEARVAKVFTDFKVELFDERQGSYEGECYDIPSTIISYNGKSINLHRCADQTQAEWIPELEGVAMQWLNACENEAEPVTGDMRYTVYEKDGGFGPNYHPVEWPLEASLKSLLEDPDLQKGFVAKDMEATKLRDLRTQALDGQLGPEKTYWIPVKDSDKGYSLYVSDTCVLEDADGMIPFHK